MKQDKPVKKWSLLCVQDCDAAIQLVQQAAAALQQAPGAGTERELQAGMLGAAAATATGPGGPDDASSCPEQQGPGSAARCNADAPDSISGHDAAVAVDASGAAPCEAAAGSGPSTAATETTAEAAAAGAADAVDADKPEGASSSTSGPLESGSSTTPDSSTTDATDSAYSAGDSSNRAAKGLQAGVDTAAAIEQQEQRQQRQGPVQDPSNLAGRLQQLLVKLLARRAAARVELQQLQQAQEDLQQALR